MIQSTPPPVQAVVEPTCIHLFESSTSGAPIDFWYSSTSSIFAVQTADWIEFNDFRSMQYFAYDRNQGVLYCAALGPNVRQEGGALFALVRGMRTFFQNDLHVDQPLEKLTFLCLNPAETDLIEHKLNAVEFEGRRCHDYYLTVRNRKLSETARMRFCTDVDANLIRMWRIDVLREGQNELRELRFEYPEVEIGNVYDLNVPRTAKRIDVTLSQELKQIVEAQETDRRRMDNHRAILAQQSTQQNSPAWHRYPELVFRKDGKFCKARAYWHDKFPEATIPLADEDPAIWWQTRIQQFQFIPWAIQVGTTSY
jgi:hypothetical protein